MTQNLVVVIPTSNRPELLDRTLDSLSGCRLPDNYRKAIVAENGPQKTSEAITRKYKDRLNITCRYLSTGNKSFALNKTLETIDNALVVFFDDDIRLAPEVLVAYSDAAKGKSSGEFYGGPFQVDYEKAPPEWLKEFLPKAAVGWNLGDAPLKIRKGQAFMGFNWAAFSDDLKRLNGFSVDHGPGSKTKALGQETEMEGRLMDAGIKGYYVPQAMVWHYVPPERCSKKFASIQAYRWGIQGGLRTTGSYYPFVRSWLKSGLLAVVNFGAPDPRKFFAPYMKFRYKSGILRGRLIRAVGIK